jgi:cyclophilin family peptidyl-prolyl cis-trans isomerase
MRRHRSHLRSVERHGPGLGAPEQLENRCLLTVNVLQPIPAQTLPEGSTQPVQIDLAGRFRVDDIAGTVVRVNVNAPGPTNHFHIELFDAAGPTRTTPAMAANFLRYVDDGSYAGTIIHRSVSNFVIQGGGFTAPIAPSNQVGGAPAPLATKGTVVDEIGNPNVRGTLAMAKPSYPWGQPVPDSATSQWFVNLKANSHLNPSFSVFARVLGTGMTFVDAVSALPVHELTQELQNGAMGEVPLWQNPPTGSGGLKITQPADFVTITGMSRVQPVVHSIASVGNPALVTASIAAGRLTIQATGRDSGTTTVTVRATSALDPNDFTDQTFSVTVADPAIESLATVRGVTLARSSFNHLLANGTPIRFNGTPVSYSHMVGSGFTPLAVAEINGQNRLVWRTPNGILHHWRLDAGFNFESSFGWQAPGTTPYTRTEMVFETDFNGDGRIPLSIVRGLTLSRDVAGGALRVNGQAILFEGRPVSYGHMAASGFTALAAADINGGNRLVWRTSTGLLHHWRLDSGWGYESSFGWQAIGTTAYNRSETAFDLDFDGNGRIGA